MGSLLVHQADRHPSSLPAALRAHAAAAPHRPWIFHPEGWDWRWLSWRLAAERLDALAGSLAARGGEITGAAAGRVAAFPWRPRPSALLLDLAIQAAGWTAWPIVAPEEPCGDELETLRRRLEELSRAAPPTLRPAAWVEDPELPCFGDEAPLPAWPLLRPGAGGRDPAPELRSTFPRAGDSGFAGGVVVEGAGAPRRLAAAELAAGARRLDRLLQSPRGERRRGREILVAGLPPTDPGERLLLAWALVVGAAWALVPRPQDRVALAAWIRPTVFSGDAEELERLAEAAERWRPPPFSRGLRRLRGEPADRPFGRLHTVLCRAPSAPPAAEAWRGRGVRLLGAPEAVMDAMRAYETADAGAGERADSGSPDEAGSDAAV